MELSLLRLVLAFGIALTCCRSVCQQNCTEKAAEGIVVRAVRDGSNSQLPLQIARLPDLTDAVIALETKALVSPIGAEVHVVCFYRVEPSSYQLRENKVVGETVQLDNYSEWLVAQDSFNDAVYVLEGAKDPTLEFNKLARDLRLKVPGAEAALSIFNFFLRVTQPQRLGAQAVHDDMELESVALTDFRLRFPAVKRRSAFNRWWGAVPGGVKSLLVPPKVKPANDDFVVQYFFYSKGNVSLRGLTIHADGTVAEGGSKTLFDKQ